MRNIHTVFPVMYQFTFPPTVYKCLLFSTFYQAFLPLMSLIQGTLTVMRCFLIFVWICISLVTSYVEHISMYILIISVIFSKMSVQSLCMFFNWVIWFCAIDLYEFLHILDINLLWDTWFANISSHSTAVFYFVGSFLYCGNAS